jgi:hypothetical protein
MKRTPHATVPAALAIAICLAAAPAFAVVAGSMVTYANARFGYAVSYPTGVFTAEPESGNGDGRVFQAKGSSTQVRVWGAYNAAGQTPQAMASEIEADCLHRPAQYRVATTGLVAVSCNIAGADILYEKHLIHGDQVTALRITYPAAESARWKTVVERVSASLRAGG